MRLTGSVVRIKGIRSACKHSRDGIEDLRRVLSEHEIDGLLLKQLNTLQQYSDALDSVKIIGESSVVVKTAELEIIQNQKAINTALSDILITSYQHSADKSKAVEQEEGQLHHIVRNKINLIQGFLETLNQDVDALIEQAPHRGKS